MSAPISSSHSQQQAPLEDPFVSTIVVRDRLTYQLVLDALRLLREGKYSKFDPHTTSNCCHGASLHVADVIGFVLDLGSEHIDTLIAKGTDKLATMTPWVIPTCCAQLGELFMLNLITNDDPERGAITDFKRLVPYGITERKSRTIVKAAQKVFANFIAHEYERRSAQLPVGFKINGVDAVLWRKYVGDRYLRMNERGILFAPNLYSMECFMGELSHSKALIGRVVDYKSKDGRVLRGRSITLFQGNGEGGFSRVVRQIFDKNRPIIILGGCTHSDDRVDLIAARIATWTLEDLTFAGEIQYPEFPPNKGGSFDASPIVPEEQAVRDAIRAFSDVGGVSAQDPSLFRLTHIYVSSVSEADDLSSLPVSYIPGEKISSQVTS